MNAQQFDRHSRRMLNGLKHDEPAAVKHAQRFLRRLNTRRVRYSAAHQYSPKWALEMRELRWVVVDVWFSIFDPKPARFMFAPWGMVGRV